MAHIQKLPQDVINRIAAGEVVQRPSAALKELLENSLDAGSRSIQVSAQDGGLEMLQVCDDGSGIEFDDLPLLCERYATSKLRSFDDLQSIASFGFRGEALASVSYVAKVTVTTKSRNNNTASTETDSGTHRADVAWKATYLDGQLTQPPEPCAGNFGTVIRAERMFYNAAVRRGALRGAEEWSRVVDVVSRYALAFPHVGFSCTREGSSTGSGVVFPKDSDTLSNIRVSHGNAVASHLHPLFHYDRSVESHISDSSPPSPSSPSSTTAYRETFASVRSVSRHVQSLRGPAGDGVFTILGFASDSTLLNRKPYLCLFINNRLVESHGIRKCVEAVYSSVLTGGNKSFVVLFITVPSERLDVNVHPTKKEVCLLDEDLLIAKLAELLRACVLQAASTRQLDMLKLQNTTAAALKAFQPAVQNPSSSSASAQQTLTQLTVRDGTAATSGITSSAPQRDRAVNSSSLEILSTLHDRAARGVAPSPLTTNSTTNAGGSQAGAGSRNTSLAGLGGGNGGVIVAPCTVVRVEPQKGALDAFFARSKPPASPPTTTFAFHNGSSTSLSSETTVTRNTSGMLGTTGDEVEVEVVSSSNSSREGSTEKDWQNVLASIRPVTAQSRGEVALHTTESGSGGDANGGAQQPERDEKEGNEQRAPDAKSLGRLAVESVDPNDSDDEDRHQLFRDLERFRERTTCTITTGDGCQDAAGAAEGAGGGVSVPETFELLAVYEASQAAETGARFHDGDREEAGRKRPAATNPIQETRDSEEMAAAAAGASQFIDVPEVETRVLTSVAAIVDGLRFRSSAAAQAFFQHLALVGIVDAHAFMAQSGTSLYLIDTLRLVREVVFQRLFLRWADPSLPRMPSLVFETPQSIEALLLFALAHDAAGMDVAPTVALREAAVAAVREQQASRKRTRDDDGARPVEPVARRRQAEALLKAAVYSGGATSLPPPPSSDTAAAAAPLEDGASCRTLAAALFVERTTIRDGGDGAGQSTGEPTKSARRYVRRLARRLVAWRDMLSEYFGLGFSRTGEVVSLPYVMNTSWPPSLRALPLFLWLLAEAVPYPTGEATTEGGEEDARARASTADLADAPSSLSATRLSGDALTQGADDAGRAVEEEVLCFTAAAKHMADTLYGLVSLPVAAESSTARETSESGKPVPASATWMNATQQPTVQEGVEMALMPCVKSKRLFYPPAVLLSDGTMQSIVSVESLYKVFERC